MTLLPSTPPYTQCVNTEATPAALSALPTKAIMYRTPNDHGVLLSEEVRTLENQSRVLTNMTGLVQGLR